ncbi:MarR family transcriptional regulator [Streptococcus anginosus]|uniref:MarR family winged helix-turn-helix transcriptional regulator n=1 Tax=Streptococcus anginosus TaxID=1328 RepID=UPI000D04747F|nr:MarR family transcriptional regulator [Streptococcus anginosus]PRT79535.1 MarR family transcriptional regulator [Streptococcus anginosus]
MEIQNSLGFILNTSAKLMKRCLDTELKAFDITSSQWAVLKLLSCEDDLSQAEISDKLSVDRATCGAVIEKLMSKDLVTKTLSKDDRRSYKVKISPKALAILEKMAQKADEVNDLAIQGLTSDELKIFIKCLHTITGNFVK